MILLNKLTDNDSQKKAMEMWVSNYSWKDILAMITKLWSSSRGSRRNEADFEIDNEEDEVLEDKEDEIELTIVDAQT